jgi:cytochrome c-type biogenesis protein CcmH
MVERYGDFVLYRPPLKATTLVLWMGPPLLFVIGLWLLLLYLRQRRSRIEVRPLSTADRARAAALLGDQQGKQS